MTQPPKPCPWCAKVLDANDPATFRETNGPKWGAVACGCGIVGPEVFMGYRDVSHWGPDAIAAWNERVGNAVDTVRMAVCAELQQIMKVYREQEKTPRGVDTPVGLENIGDVWGLFSKME